MDITNSTTISKVYKSRNILFITTDNGVFKGNIKDFHEKVLKYGPIPLEILIELV